MANDTIDRARQVSADYEAGEACIDGRPLPLMSSSMSGERGGCRVGEADTAGVSGATLVPATTL